MLSSTRVSRQVIKEFIWPMSLKVSCSATAPFYTPPCVSPSQPSGTQRSSTVFYGKQYTLELASRSRTQHSQGL